MKNKVFTVMVCACITVAVIIVSSNSLLSFGADENNHTMFVNDEPWYNETQFKWINIFLVDYIPISMLEKIEGIVIDVNNYLRNVMISYGDSQYMTFEIDTGTVYTANGKNYSVSTYLIYRERYIPAELVCDYFGLKFEITEKETAVRISDGSEKMSFNDLLLMYNPALANIETSSDTAAETAVLTTASETTSPPVTQEEIKERMICFAFSGCPNKYTQQIMDILESYDYKALFLIDYANMADNSAVIRRMAVDGHTIGIMLPADKNNEVMFNDMEIKTNNLLYYIVKFKTRIISAEVLISDDDRLSIESAGYVITESNSKLPVDENISSRSVINKAEEFIRENEVVLYRFYSNAVTVLALPKILDYIAGIPQFTVKTLNETQ